MEPDEVEPLVMALWNRGVTLLPVEGKLHVHSWDPLADDDKRVLSENKEAILQWHDAECVEEDITP